MKPLPTCWDHLMTMIGLGSDLTGRKGEALIRADRELVAQAVFDYLVKGNPPTPEWEEFKESLFK